MMDRYLTLLNAVDDSDTPVTLKQGQGNQTWYELVDTKQHYNLLKAKLQNLV